MFAPRSLVAAMALLSAGLCSAQPYFVSPTGGDDANPGNSPIGSDEFTKTEPN